MRVEDYHELPVAFVEVDEALGTSWSDHPEVAVVRVERPPVTAWPALRDAGFVVKPQFITWMVGVQDSDEAYLAELKSTERQRIRKARRTLADAGGTLELAQLTPQAWQEFLSVYDTTIESMVHGVNVAREQQDLVLDQLDDYLIVTARIDGELVGGCLARRDRDHDRLLMRFSAVDPAWRDGSLARVLYLQMAQAARDLQIDTFGLGSDRNLYGHIAKPGLIRFKKTLGLRPHASHLVDDHLGYDQADLILSVEQLTDPTLLFGYAGSAPGHDFSLIEYGLRDCNASPFQSLSVTPVQIRRPLHDGSRQEVRVG